MHQLRSRRTEDALDDGTLRVQDFAVNFGTDFSVAPVVIDPSLEPGFSAKIRRKVFGN